MQPGYFSSVVLVPDQDLVLCYLKSLCQSHVLLVGRVLVPVEFFQHLYFPLSDVWGSWGAPEDVETLAGMGDPQDQGYMELWVHLETSVH